MKIKEIAKINPRDISVKELEWINYVDTAAVEDGRLVGMQCLQTDFPSRAQRSIRQHDILISAVRPILKHNYYVSKSISHGVASTGFIQIRTCEPKVLPQYLYYFLTTDSKINMYQSIAETSQSTFPTFNKDIIEELVFSAVSLDDQQHIVDTVCDYSSLSSIA